MNFPVAKKETLRRVHKNQITVFKRSEVAQNLTFSILDLKLKSSSTTSRNYLKWVIN